MFAQNSLHNVLSAELDCTAAGSKTHAQTVLYALQESDYQTKCSQLSSKPDNFGTGKVMYAVQSSAKGMAII